jgi:hypothetical protein
MWGIILALMGFFILTNRALLSHSAGFWPLLIFPLILLLFGWLTVDLDDEALRVRFGIGLIRKTIPLEGVQSAQAVRNRWYWGWGIRFFPGGTLFNVSGLDAVELCMSHGRKYRIGTDQPHVLASALDACIGERPGRTDSLAPSWCAPAGFVTRFMLGALAVGLVALIGFVVIMTIAEPKPPRAEITSETLTIRSFLYESRVPLREITAVTLESRPPCVLRRTNGFAAAGVLRGHFDVQGLGNGMLFVNIGGGPYLFVRTAHSFVIVNFDDARETQALAAGLQADRAR